jgi:hypothetical protein
MRQSPSLTGADRANALAVVLLLEDLLQNSSGRLRMHAHAIRQALERADRLDARWLAQNEVRP